MEHCTWCVLKSTALSSRPQWVQKRMDLAPVKQDLVQLSNVQMPEPSFRGHPSASKPKEDPNQWRGTKRMRARVYPGHERETQCE